MEVYSYSVVIRKMSIGLYNLKESLIQNCLNLLKKKILNRLKIEN